MPKATISPLNIWGAAGADKAWQSGGKGLRAGTEAQDRMVPALSSSFGIWVALCAQLVKFTASCASLAKLSLTVRIQIKGSPASTALPPRSSLDYIFSMDYRSGHVLLLKRKKLKNWLGPNKFVFQKKTKCEWFQSLESLQSTPSKSNSSSASKIYWGRESKQNFPTSEDTAYLLQCPLNEIVSFPPLCQVKLQIFLLILLCCLPEHK